MTTHKRITYVQLNARIAAATDGQVAIRSYDGKDGNLGFVFYDGDRDEKRAMTHFAPVRHTKLSAISVDQWIEEAKAYQADVKSRTRRDRRGEFDYGGADFIRRGRGHQSS